MHIGKICRCVDVLEMLLAMSSIYIFITCLYELKLQEAFIKCNYWYNY